MKKMRKIASFVLAMVIVLAMSMTAMAAGTGTITVENPIDGQTYTAYKIFDVEYYTKNNADNTSENISYVYTIKDDSAWYSTVAMYANAEDTTDADGLTLTKSTERSTDATVVYVVEINEKNFDVTNFSNTLKTFLDSELENEGSTFATDNGVSLTNTNGSMTATNLELGYYFVSSTTGALCNLTTTDPAVTISDKNDIRFEKEDNKYTVDLGEIVKYTISGVVPDTTGFGDAYVYEITDTMTSGLTYNNDAQITIITDESSTDPATKVSIEDATITKESGVGDTTIITIDIPVEKYQNYKGKTIEITYTAVVNENAVGTVQKNSASLEYTNGPGTTDTTIVDEEKVYSAKIVINKTDNSEPAIPLEGATFILKKTHDKDGNALTALAFYKYDAETKSVNWAQNQNDATSVTTDADGEASFDGLADGKYELIEIVAPQGYNLLKEAKVITIDRNTDSNKINMGVDEDGTGDSTEPLVHTETVVNTSGTLLPSTGGIGTTIFYIVGGLLVIAALVVLIARKRMDMEEK